MEGSADLDESERSMPLTQGQVRSALTLSPAPAPLSLAADERGWKPMILL